MTKHWVHQTELYGLGNFINLTPTIKLMADHFDERIPVYFDFAFIRDCFLDCPFIEILKEQPDNSPLFTSGLVNYKNNCPDYLHAYKEVTKALPLAGEIPYTYVDRCEEITTRLPESFTLFIRGSGREHLYYLGQKMPHDDYYRGYFNENVTGLYLQIFTGSQGDLDRSGDLFKDMPIIVNDIRHSLALIRDAGYVVANDSGLAHAAAAMNKNMVILWKNTSLPKNANPNKNCSYKMCH